MNQQRKGQRLVNYILAEFRDFIPGENLSSYLNEAGRFLDGRLFNMSNKEFDKVMRNDD